MDMIQQLAEELVFSPLSLCILYILTPRCVIHRPVAPASPGSLSEGQKLRSHLELWSQNLHFDKSLSDS